MSDKRRRKVKAKLSNVNSQGQPVNALTTSELIEELEERLSDLTATAVRPTLDRATKHFVNLNRVMEKGFKVVANIKTLNKVLPGIVNQFSEIGEFDERSKAGAEEVLKRAQDSGEPIQIEGTAQNKSMQRFRGGKMVYSAYNELSNHCKDLFKLVDGSGTGQQMGHLTVTPISVQLALVAQGYQKLEDSISAFSENFTPHGNTKLENFEQVGPTQIANLKKIGVKTVADIRVVKKQVQTLMFGFELLQKVPYTEGQKPVKGVDTYDALIDAYNKTIKEGESFDVQATKNKIINTVNGKIGLELNIESPKYNQFKKTFETILQKGAGNVMRGKEIPDNLARFLKKVDIGDVVGSPSIEGKIVADITAIAQGKKPRAYKGKTTKKRTASATKKRKKISKAPVKKFIKESSKAKAATVRAVASSQKKGKKGKTGRDQLNLAKIQAAINTRLPAEVRRNMGRPALINQTGRFSNSVRVTGLRQAPNSVVADYTYQLNPYETFENNGVRQWPTGYNPKPLISKSIRNLAAAFIDQKFTLRRV